MHIQRYIHLGKASQGSPQIPQRPPLCWCWTPNPPQYSALSFSFWNKIFISSFPNILNFWHAQRNSGQRKQQIYFYFLMLNIWPLVLGTQPSTWRILMAAPSSLTVIVKTKRRWKLCCVPAVLLSVENVAQKQKKMKQHFKICFSLVASNSSILKINSLNTVLFLYLWLWSECALSHIITPNATHRSATLCCA